MQLDLNKSINHDFWKKIKTLETVQGIMCGSVTFKQEVTEI